MSYNKNRYLKVRDKLFILLISTLIIDSICLFLGDMQIIAEFNYTLHELFYLPINISIVILPLEVIALVYYSIKHFNDIWQETISMNLIYKIKIFISVICMVFVISIIYYQFNYEESSTIYSVDNKTTDGGKTYIVVDGINIKCTLNEYRLIDVNKEYLISYKWNKFKPNEGKLQSIQTLYRK